MLKLHIVCVSNINISSEVELGKLRLRYQCDYFLHNRLMENYIFHLLNALCKGETKAFYDCLLVGQFNPALEYDVSVVYLLHNLSKGFLLFLFHLLYFSSGPKVQWLCYFKKTISTRQVDSYPHLGFIVIIIIFSHYNIN